MNKLLIFFVAIFLGGCVSTTNFQPIQFEEKNVRLPEIGKVSSSRLGDSLLKYAKSRTYPALKVDGTHRYQFCLYHIDLEAQSAPLKYIDPEKGEVYEAKVYVIPGGTNNRRPELSKITGYQSSGYFLSGMGCGVPKLLMQNATKNQVTDIKYPAFTQELIYNGRVGDSIRIVYREYSNDMARAAFSQEAQYDLSISNIIAFKGAQLKIINATNESIEYQVLSHFEKIQY